MRHGVKKAKLQRTASHRKAMLANQACSLISNGRITTTLAKAKALRPYVEKLITLARKGTLHTRRQVLATLPQPKVVGKLFGEVVDAINNREGGPRQGGYCRIVKIGQRKTDSAPMALIEIIDLQAAPAPAAEPVATSTSEAPAEA